MARTKENNYFKMFLNLADYSYACAKELSVLLDNFNQESLKDRLEDFHKIENAADEQKHIFMEKLAREFITPIEREDILQIVEILDDITDAIEDIPIKLYMYNVKNIRNEARELGEIILTCCKTLYTILEEFHNFKKSRTMQQSIIEMNRLEEVGDKIYMKAVRSLYEDSMNQRETMAWTPVYHQMEKCCDLCEHAANMVEGVIMKNT